MLRRPGAPPPHVGSRHLVRNECGLLEWAIERGFHVAAEALFDAGNHILAGEFADAADEYAQIPVHRAARGVIRPETATRLRSLAGCRNILVHDYTTIDPQRLIEGLGRLDDVDAFAADVEAWLAKH